MKNIRVCFWGIFEMGYPRNYIFIEGLKKIGCKVSICNADFKNLSEYKKLNGKVIIILNLLFAFLRRFFLYLYLSAVFAVKYRASDIIITGCEYHEDVVWANFLARVFRKKLIFNALNSNYETSVIDRKAVRTDSLFAKYIFGLDKLSFNLPDIIIVDTHQHEKYFSELFNADMSKFKVVYVGADEKIFTRAQKREKRENALFEVVFYGSYVPLHGVEYVIEAADILKGENIKFTLVGDGQLKEEIKKKAAALGLSNVQFLDFAEKDALLRVLEQVDAGLGVFGATEKAGRVIPHKMFQMMMYGLPVITADTEAVREIFTDGEHCLFCKAGDGRDIAQKIILLKNDKKLKEKISAKGGELVLTQFNTDKTAELFLNAVRCTLYAVR